MQAPLTLYYLETPTPVMPFRVELLPLREILSSSVTITLQEHDEPLAPVNCSWSC